MIIIGAKSEEARKQRARSWTRRENERRRGKGASTLLNIGVESVLQYNDNDCLTQRKNNQG